MTVLAAGAPDPSKRRRQAQAAGRLSTLSKGVRPALPALVRWKNFILSRPAACLGPFAWSPRQCGCSCGFFSSIGFGLYSTTTLPTRVTKWLPLFSAN
jgi:hypothetical protein